MNEGDKGEVMVKKYVFRDIDLSVLNLDSAFQEAKKKNITGFLKITYWSREDYVLFFEGTPFKVITVHADGRRLSYGVEKFRVEGSQGTASFVETSLDDIVGFQILKRDPQRDGASIFFPYGSLVHEPTSLNYLDVNKEVLMAQNNGLDGYIAIYTRESLLGMVVFAQGNPVKIVGGNGTFGKNALEYINTFMTPAKSYMSVYNVDTELLPFMYSLLPNNLRRVESTFNIYQEAQEYVNSSKRSAIVMLEGGGIYRYDFFFNGQHVDRLVKDKGLLIADEEEKHRLSIKIENMPESNIAVYEVIIETHPSPIEVEFASQEPAEQQVGGKKIETQDIEKVKDIFVKELGPVGKILWNRVLEELALQETEMNSMQMKLLLERLQKEMPDESAKEEFISRVKSALGDII